jgi:hypothetical protein
MQAGDEVAEVRGADLQQDGREQLELAATNMAVRLEVGPVLCEVHVSLSI